MKPKTSETITTLRVKDELRKKLMIEKQELGLRSIDELVLLLLNTHYIHNRKKEEKI